MTWGSMKWVENHEILGSKASGDKTLGDFFLFIQALVDRVLNTCVGRR